MKLLKDAKAQGDLAHLLQKKIICNSPFMTAVEAVNTSKYNGKERSIFDKHMGMDFSR
jgi:hypothetical protein